MRGGIAVVLAVLANVGLVPAVDAPGIDPAFRALSILPVALLSALGADGATVVYRLLGRYVGGIERTAVINTGAANNRHSTQPVSTWNTRRRRHRLPLASSGGLYAAGPDRRLDPLG
jgi:hypothetical protein